VSDTYGVSDSVRQACLSDSTAARLTEDKIRAALDGLAAQPVKPFDWLTLAIQSAIHFGRELAEKQRENSN
jgi:hypothetical protein